MRPRVFDPSLTDDVAALAEELAGARVAGVTIAWADNNGIPRSRTVPVGRLADVAVQGVGITTLFAVFDSHDAITFEHPGLSTPSGDIRLVPEVGRITRLAGQPAFAWAPGRQLAPDGSPWPYDQPLRARGADGARRGARARAARRLRDGVLRRARRRRPSARARRAGLQPARAAGRRRVRRAAARRPRWPSSPTPTARSATTASISSRSSMAAALAGRGVLLVVEPAQRAAAAELRPELWDNGSPDARRPSAPSA